MSTENIDIRVREDGSRVVQRNLQDLADSGQKAGDAMGFLKKALELLAVAYVADKVREYADAWNAATGLIQVATKTHEEAVEVQQRLFEAAQHTRTAFGDMSELYARVARSATELGASQEQAIQFTEEVGKALVIQHTSATQASGALLQLGQLLGTGRVKAQEFNSVGEQLGTILVTVAKHIDGAGGSVSKLRQMMLDGNLTSKQFFDAFLKGNADLESSFQKANATIGQGLTVLRNAMIKFVGELDHAVGFSNAFTKAASAIANNMDTIKVVLKDLILTLGVGAAAWATYATAQGAATATAALSAVVSYALAVRNGTVVALGSAEAERQRAVALYASAAAQADATATEQASNVIKVRAALAVTEAEVAKNAAYATSIVVARESAVAALAKANADLASARATQAAAAAAGAQSFALATLRTATADAAVAEQARVAALAELASLGQASARVTALQTEALAAQATAQEALNAAQAQSVAANAAALASKASAAKAAEEAAAKAAGTTGLLAQGFAGLGSILTRLLAPLRAFGAIIVANPVTALLTALVTAIGLLVVFGDKIAATKDGLTTMKDVVDALWVNIKNAFSDMAAVVQAFWASITGPGTKLGAIFDGVASAFSKVSSIFSDLDLSFAGVARGAARALDLIVAVAVGTAYAVVAAFKSVPDLITGEFKKAYNGTVGVIEDLVNTTIDGLNTIRGALGQSLIDSVKFQRLDVDPAPFASAGAAVSKAFSDGFNSEGGYFESKVKGLIDQAKLIAVGRLNSTSGFRAPGVDLNTPTKPTAPSVDQKEIDKVRDQLRHLLDTVDPTEGAILELAKAQKVLTEAMKLHIITQAQYNVYMDAAKQHYKDIIDPLDKYMRDIAQQNQLLDLSAQARATEGEVMDKVATLQAKNIPVGQAEIDILRQAIAARNEHARVVQQEDSMIAATVEARQTYLEQLQALENLLNRPSSGVTKQDLTQTLVANNQELFQGTKQLVEYTTGAYRDMYFQIEEMEKHHLITSETANQLRINQAELLKQKLLDAEVQASQARLALGNGDFADGLLVGLSRLSNGFHNFTESTSQVMGDFFVNLEQGFADSIGKAAVDSANLGDALKQVAKDITAQLISALVKLGIEWLAHTALVETASTAATATSTAESVTAAAVTASAWATAAAMVNAATFGAAAVAGDAALASSVALANGLAATSAIPKYETGGYTGDLATHQVAGIVHGQEFVINARATARNRGLLEAINAGADVSKLTPVKPAPGNRGTPIQVSIENHGTSKEFEVQQLSPSEVRLIARDEVAKHAPTVVAQHIRQPNSPVSKSLRDATTVQRRR